RHDHDEKRDECEHVCPQGVRQPATDILPNPGNWQHDGEHPDRRDHKSDAASSPDSYDFLLTCHAPYPTTRAATPSATTTVPHSLQEQYTLRINTADVSDALVDTVTRAVKLELREIRGAA